LGSSSGTGSIGLGFAIPITQTRRIIDELIATGKSTRPLLGVEFDFTYTGEGARIGKFSTNSAAQKAGIPLRSVITKIGKFNIREVLDAFVRIRSYAPGDSIEVTVTTPSGTTATYSVVLGSAPSN